ncbi:MAG: hypothetical protein WBN90_05745, partial [Gammaproteobacteria bacterium]
EKLDHQGGDMETHGRVDISSDMTRYDALRLRRLIEKHVRYTNSARGRSILDHWTAMLPKFIKVMPVDYRRALQDMQAAQTVAAQAKGDSRHG